MMKGGEVACDCCQATDRETNKQTTKKNVIDYKAGQKWAGMVKAFVKNYCTHIIERR